MRISLQIRPIDEQEDGAIECVDLEPWVPVRVAVGPMRDAIAMLVPVDDGFVLDVKSVMPIAADLSFVRAEYGVALELPSHTLYAKSV